MGLMNNDLSEFDALSVDETAESDQNLPRTLVTFRLGPQVFAVDVGWVREVVDICETAPLPGAPHGVIGMIDLREETISIMDLASRLGIRSAEGKDTRIIVFTFGDDESAVSLGVIADQVLRVCEIDAHALEPMPDTKTGWRSADIEGLVRTEDGNAMVLEIEKILCAGADQPGEFDFG